MYFVRYILLMFLLLLCAGCNQNPDTVDADDFGFPKKFITAVGSGVQGQNEGEYSKWQDTGLEIMETDAKLIIDVKKSWTSWFAGNASYVFGNTICYYRSSAGLNLANPADYPSDVNDFTALGILNAPCFLNKGVGLYMLVTDPNIPGFNPNSSENEIKSPSSFTTHLAPNMPGAGDTPNGGWYNSIPAGAQYNGHIYMKVLDRYYDDNSGGYKVTFKSGVEATAKGPVETVIDMVTSTFGNAAKTMFQNVVMDSGFIAAVRVVLNVYILFTAIAYMFGLMDVSQGELVGRIFKFGLILALISDNSWNFFNDYFFTLFIGTDGKESGVEEIIGIVLKTLTGGSAEDGMRVFDSMWNKFTSPETTAKIWSLLFSQAEGFFYIPLLYIVMFLFLMAMARAVLFYLLSVVAMSMLVILAPIFLTFMLFSMTKHLYSEWLKQMMSFAIQPVVLFAALALMGNMVMTILYKTLGFPVSWSPFIHIPFVNIDFKFWMPDIGGSGAHTISTIMLPPSYEVAGQRYPDLPFLDPANADDASRISRIVNDHEVVNFQDIFLFMIVVYVMHTFNALVPILARGLAGTANGMMNLEKGAAMMMNNAVNAPGNAASFAGRMAAAAYDRNHGKGSAEAAMTATRKQLMGGTANPYNRALKSLHSYQDGVGGSIEGAQTKALSTVTGGVSDKFSAAHKAGTQAVNSRQDQGAALLQKGKNTITDDNLFKGLKAGEKGIGKAFFGADGKTVGGVSRDKGATGPVSLNAASALSEGPVRILTGKEMQNLSKGIEKSESNVKILGAHDKLLSAMRNSEERPLIDAKAALSAKVAKEEGTLAGAKATMERTEAKLQVASRDVKALTAIDKLNNAIAQEKDPGKRQLLETERAGHISKLSESSKLAFDTNKVGEGQLAMARGAETRLAKQLEADTAKVQSRESKLEMVRKEEAKGTKEADAKLAAIAAKYDPEQKAVAERLTKERDGLSSMQKEKEDGAAALAKSKHPEDEKTMKELVAKGDKEMLAAVVKEKAREEGAIKEALAATREREGAERNLKAQEEGGDKKSIQEAKERLAAAREGEKAKDKALQAISKEGEPRKGEEGLSKEAVLEKRLAEVQAQKAVAEEHQKAVVERDTLVKQGGIADPATVRAAEERCQKAGEAHLDSMNGVVVEVAKEGAPFAPEAGGAGGGTVAVKTEDVVVPGEKTVDEREKFAAMLEQRQQEEVRQKKQEVLQEMMGAVKTYTGEPEGNNGGGGIGSSLEGSEKLPGSSQLDSIDDRGRNIINNGTGASLGESGRVSTEKSSAVVVEQPEHTPPPASVDKPVNKAQEFAEMIEQRQQEEARQKKQEVLQEMMGAVKTYTGEPEGSSGGGGGIGSSLEGPEKQSVSAQLDSIDDRGRNIINNGTGASLGESGRSVSMETSSAVVVEQPERTPPPVPPKGDEVLPVSEEKPVNKAQEFAEMIEQRQQEEARQQKQEDLKEMMAAVKELSGEPMGDSGGYGNSSTATESVGGFEGKPQASFVEDPNDRGRAIKSGGTADYSAPRQEREVQSSSEVVEERSASQREKEVDHSGDVSSSGGDVAQSRHHEEEVIEDRGREVNERGTGGPQSSSDELYSEHSSSSRTHEEVSQPYMDPVIEHVVDTPAHVIEHADVQITHVVEPVVESQQIVNDPSPGGNLLDQPEVNELPKTKAEEFAERIQDQEMVKEAKQRMEDLGTMMETIDVINAEKRGGGGVSEHSGALDSSTLTHDKHEKPIPEPDLTTGPGGRRNTVSSAVNIPPTSGKKD